MDSHTLNNKPFIIQGMSIWHTYMQLNKTEIRKESNFPKETGSHEMKVFPKNYNSSLV